VVSGSQDGVRVWDLESGAELRVLRGHEVPAHSVPAAWVESVAVAPDGSRVVSGGSDGTVRVWDIESGAELMVLRGHEAPVWSVAVAPDGRRVVSGSWSDETVQVWDLESGQCLQTIPGFGHGDVDAIAVGPYPFRALERHGETVIEEVETGSTVAVYPARLRDIATSPSGRTWVLAVGSHVDIVALEGGR
jgi:WD40 repeat protein